MSQKVLAIAAALVIAAGLFLVAPVVAVVALISQASSNQCLDSTLTAAGGPARIPIAGEWATTSEYGMRKHPLRGDYSKHHGLDFTGSSTIVAAKSGVVADVLTTAGEGKEIVLEHGDGLQTKYKHLASMDVTKGDRVWSGKKIGVMGTTGAWSTGVHLHFEVIKDGRDVDPRRWLKLKGKSGKAPGAAKSGNTPDTSDVSTVDRSSASSGPRRVGATSSKLPNNVAGYNRSQLKVAATIIDVGRKRDLNGRAITIGVMAAMGESSLSNPNHGDAARNDTIGTFQIGPEHGAYKDRMDPAWSAGNFFDRMEAVPGWQKLKPTIAAHRAQRNADPNHYTRFWKAAVKVVAALTNDRALGQGLAFPDALEGCEDVETSTQASSGDGSGAAIVEAAERQIGQPYSWGGGTAEGPSKGIRSSIKLDGTNTVGFDCSGLVLYAVHQATGITLPRTAGPQGLDKRGKTIQRDYAKMKPGDVIAFSSSGSRAPGSFEHIGIYAGDGEMIHAPRPGKDVERIKLKGNSYYESQTWSIKRFAKK